MLKRTNDFDNNQRKQIKACSISNKRSQIIYMPLPNYNPEKQIEIQFN